MRFGGHETFALGPGWLTKGLFLVAGADDLVRNSDQASDAMGVGRNMSKSIRWWLGRCGLVHRPARLQPLQMTELDQAVLAHDPYLARLATWWLLHIELTAGSPEDVFSWFFGDRRDARFTREGLEGRMRPVSPR